MFEENKEEKKDERPGDQGGICSSLRALVIQPIQVDPFKWRLLMVSVGKGLSRILRTFSSQAQQRQHMTGRSDQVGENRDCQKAKWFHVASPS